MRIISERHYSPALMSKLIWTIFLGTSAVHAQVLGPPPSPTPSQLSCAANIASAPTIHAEGMTELVGDITLICTGGAATTAGAAVPSINVTLFFNTSVTSRLYANGWSEALLLIDEPGSGLPGTTNTQLACNDPNGLCLVTGTGNGQGTFDGSAGRPNIFQGVVSGIPVTFFGVPIDPPQDVGR